MKNKEVLTREMLLRSEIFWMELIRNQIFNEVHSYMTENNITRQELANKLGYSKGYISQILNGNGNLSFQKLTELALAINKVPYLYLKDIDEVVEKDRDGQSIFIDFKELEEKSERCAYLEGFIHTENFRADTDSQFVEFPIAADEGNLTYELDSTDESESDIEVGRE